MIINGQETNANLFAYDGCHKIYLIEDDDDKNHAMELGYELFAISEIVDKWNNSCELRFISNWKLTKRFINQFEDVADNVFVFD